MTIRWLISEVNMNPQFLVAAAASLCFNYSHAQQRIEYVGTMKLGQGYDLINGEIRQTDCIKPISISEEKKYPSQRSSFKYDEIVNTESMRQFLQVNAAASYNDIAGSSAEGKMEFVNSTDSYNSNSIFSFRNIIESAETTAEHWNYEDAQKRIAKDPEQFKVDCGTHYISAIIWGGEFYGTVSHSVKSEDERTAFKAAATGSFSNTDVSGSIGTSLDRSIFSSTLRAEGKKAGGPARKRKYTISDLRTEMENFPLQVAKKHFPTTVILVKNPTPPVTLKSIALEESANLLLRYKDAEKQLDSIEVDPSNYYINENVPASVVIKIRRLLRDNKNLVISTMEKCKSANEKNTKSFCDLSKVPFAYPPSVNQLARLYKSTCNPVFTPEPLEDGQFIGLPLTNSDGSMGGQDVAAATIQYFGEKGGFVKRNIALRVVETRPNYSQFTKQSESIVWSEAKYPGCTLASTLSFPAIDAGSRFPLDGNSDTAVNDYMTLNYGDDSKYLYSAVCRSNQMGDDTGFVGCKSFTFRPITLPLQHVELKAGDPPQLSVPEWLAKPSASKAYLNELHSKFPD